MPEIIAVGVILSLLGAGYYSMVLFPKQRDFTRRQQMARELARDDEIVTYGGIIGRVLSIDAAAGTAILEIAPGVEIRVVVAAMLYRFDPAEVARNARLGQEAPIQTAN